MQNLLKILLLICAGEMIFSLPFHLTRFFRPSFLNVFELSNTQLGDMFSSYGVLAFLSYFPGGIISDRFSASKLISLSLILTGLGGFYLYSIPSNTGLYFLYAYWGVTTILLFWAPLIKATKEWGADKHQGLAFGVLDGGRGLVASFVASIILFFLSSEVSKQSFQNITLLYSSLTILIGILSYFIFSDTRTKTQESEKINLTHLIEVLKNQNIWLIGIIIIISYCGYKALDNYGIYTHQILGMSEVDSAKFVTYISYTRVFIAVIIGFLADKIKITRTTFILFASLLSLFALTPVLDTSMKVIILANLTITTLAVYGLRAIYFALVKEANVKEQYTGTAVGIISVVGYTPDIFFASISGRILDSGTPAEGFKMYFFSLAAICIIGLISTYLIIRKNKIKLSI